MPELLIGCGNRRDKMVSRPGRENWDGLVTLDANPKCSPDILHDLNELPYPFEDNSFDEQHSYHCLEHVGRQGDWKFFFAQWSEFWRIMKPDGIFVGIVPAWNSVWAWGDPSHTRIITLESLGFLNQNLYSQIGHTPMSDFRDIYKANWEQVYSQVTDHETIFCLRAVKNG